MTSKKPVIAAIDLGTNSFHLVITSVSSKGTLQVYTTEKEMVRLGSSKGDMKQIKSDALQRGINCLTRFAELAKSRKAEVVAVATSAVREASNKDEFIQKVKKATGINVDVVSGLEEGRLIYIGVIHALPILKKKALIIDIGGGSTETVVGLNGEIKYVHSAKLGAIRMTKRFNLDTNPSLENIEACRDYINGEWAPIIKRLKECEFETVVGTSGTILSLAVMAMNHKSDEIPELLNGITVSSKRIFSVINKIIRANTVEERQKIPKMDQSRADIILGGALILEYILKELNIQKLNISTYALREGIVFNYQQKLNVSKKFEHLGKLRYESIKSAASHFNINMEHANHVLKTSLILFDDLQEIHKLGSKERELLEAAAVLHDVGYYISHDMHHKHSYYIIQNCMLPGFTNNEKELIANIARYHRKSHPKKKHEGFSTLNKKNQEVVRILSSFLRIGEGIDRRQLQNVLGIRGELNNREYTLYLKPKSDIDDILIEVWGANRRKPLLEESLNISIQFRLDIE